MIVEKPKVFPNNKVDVVTVDSSNNVVIEEIKIKDGKDVHESVTVLPSDTTTTFVVMKERDRWFPDFRKPENLVKVVGETGEDKVYVVLQRKPIIGFGLGLSVGIYSNGSYIKPSVAADVVRIGPFRPAASFAYDDVEQVFKIGAEIATQIRPHLDIAVGKEIYGGVRPYGAVRYRF